MTIVNQLRYVMAILIAFLLINSAIFYHLLNDMKYDGCVINYSGMVRGATQQLVKMELYAHHEDSLKNVRQRDQLIIKLDNIINGLINGDSELKLRRATNDNYLLKMKEVSNAWEHLKQTIMRARKNAQFRNNLLKESNDYFELTNKAVTASEVNSIAKVRTTSNIQFITFILNLIILASIWFMSQKKIGKPLTYLKNKVDDITKGSIPVSCEKNIEIQVQGNDEISALAISIKKMHGYLAGSRKNLHSLAGYLLSVREEERAHISREIHDELGQILTTINMDLLSLEKKLPKDQMSLNETIKSISKLIEIAINTVQEISSDLRPRLLDDLGLKASLKWYAKKIKKQGEIACELFLDFENANLDQKRTITVFRIIQEALTNIVRHAHATKARTSLIENGNSLKIEVKDNGIGITQKQISDSESLGIIGLQERVYLCGGKVEIKGTQNKGTTVSVCIPLDKSLKKNIQNAQNAKDNQERENC